MYVKVTVMIKRHQGEVSLDHNFTSAFNRLSGYNQIELQTEAGTRFSAKASRTRDGRRIIRFFQEGMEYGR